jgi:hypothetical protein
MSQRTYEVRKHNHYKTRWVCLIFEPGVTERKWSTGSTFGRVFPSKVKAQKFGEMVLEMLE